MAAHGFWQYLRLKAIVTLFRFLNRLAVRSLLQPSDACLRKFIRIPSRDLNRFIDAWLYYPDRRTFDEADSPSSPPGLVVNWHGAGYIMPNLGMDHAYCDRIARESNVIVLDADYRKGPENVFPGAVEDAEDVLRWVQSQSRRFDLDRVALSGFSSGGHLCLVAASELRNQFKAVINIRAVYCFYGGTDFTIPEEEKKAPDPIRPLPPWALRLFADSYLPNVEDRQLPTASPAKADVNSFPPHLMLFTCSGDVLAPELEAFGEKMKKETTKDVQLMRIEGVAHGFDKKINPKLYNEEKTDMAYSMVIKSLKEVMH